MNCDDARQFLLLAGYGELSFDEEEALELHVACCPGCLAARNEISTLESLLAQAELDPPPGLLARCRRNLAVSINEQEAPARRFSVSRLWNRWVIHPPMWLRPVGALAMLSVGFFAARAVPQSGVLARLTGAPAQPASIARVRLVNAADSGQVRVQYDEIRQREMTGSLQDDQIRAMLLSAAADPSDPGLRVDTMDLLKDHCERDEVRSVLLHALRNDPNSGVRLKALDGLKAYAREPETRQALTEVVQRDDNPGVRVQAIDLLLQNRQPEVVGLLQELLRSEENGYVRSRSQKALREMKASVDTF
jgi:hypothetical protein